MPHVDYCEPSGFEIGPLSPAAMPAGAKVLKKLLFITQFRQQDRCCWCSLVVAKVWWKKKFYDVFHKPCIYKSTNLFHEFFFCFLILKLRSKSKKKAKIGIYFNRKRHFAAPYKITKKNLWKRNLRFEDKGFVKIYDGKVNEPCLT